MWQLPVQRAHRVAGSAGALTFVGGAADFDDNGRIRHPADLIAQTNGALQSLADALAVESCTLDDVIRLKVFYQSTDASERWTLLARLSDAFSNEPAPVITANPVPLQPFEGQAIQVQAIASKNWRSLEDIRSAIRELPSAVAGEFSRPVLTRGLRAGEFFAVGGHTAIDDQARLTTEDGIQQTHQVMSDISNVLDELGASFQDSIKKEGYYFGTTMEQWAAMATVRASYFREPGPVATVVPCHILWPAGSLTQVEVLGMRTLWNGFDKYVPREDRWPERVWDWPIPVPYRQGIRLRNTIWTGGQVPFEPGTNSGTAMYPGNLIEQTRFTMGYIEEILRDFDATTSDLRLLVCYFASDGSQAQTCRFIDAIAECVSGPLPPLTVVPQPHMHSEDMGVEIWGVARA